MHLHCIAVCFFTQLLLLSRYMELHSLHMQKIFLMEDTWLHVVSTSLNDTDSV